jgi:putative PIN family toxin of toxin-antitoxin system
MRIVLDTNVVISGFLSRGGPPATLIDLWAEGRVTVVVSQPLLEEYIGVLARPKFDRTGPAEERLHLLEELIALDNTDLVFPKERVTVIEEDPADNLVLECAAAGRPDYIVSGDDHLLRLGKFGEIPVVTPRQFLEVLLGK